MGIAEPELKESDLEGKQIISLSGPTLSDVVFLQRHIPQTSCR